MEDVKKYSTRCGKNRYRTVRLAIRYAITSSRLSGLPMRTYRCPDCSGWHLTKRREWSSKRVEARTAELLPAEARHPNGHRRSCPCGQCAWFPAAPEWSRIP
jgi:hypothetical protein